MMRNPHRNKGGRPRKDTAYLVYADDEHALRKGAKRGEVGGHKIIGKVAQDRKVSKKVVRDARKRHAKYFDRLDRAWENPILFDSDGKPYKK